MQIRPKSNHKTTTRPTRLRIRPIRSEIRTKTGAVLNHSPASACHIRQCDKLQQVVQLNFVKMTSTLLQKFKKMLPARSFHSDQTKTSTTTQDQEQSLPDQDNDQNHCRAPFHLRIQWLSGLDTEQAITTHCTVCTGSAQAYPPLLLISDRAVKQTAIMTIT